MSKKRGYLRLVPHGHGLPAKHRSGAHSLTVVAQTRQKGAHSLTVVAQTRQKGAHSLMVVAQTRQETPCPGARGRLLQGVMGAWYLLAIACGAGCSTGDKKTDADADVCQTCTQDTNEGRGQGDSLTDDTATDLSSTDLAVDSTQDIEIVDLPGYSPIFEVRQRASKQPDDPFVYWAPLLRFQSPAELPDSNITGVVAVGPSVWVGTDSGLLAIDLPDGAAFQFQPPFEIPIQGLARVAEETLSFWSGDSVWLRSSGTEQGSEGMEQWLQQFLLPEAVLGAVGCLNKVLVLTASGPWYLEDPDQAKAVPATPAGLQWRSMACGSNRLWLAAGDQVWTYDGELWAKVFEASGSVNHVALSDDGWVAAATMDSVAMWDSQAGVAGVQELKAGVGGLPAGGITSLRWGHQGACWVGHEEGLTKIQGAELRHFRSLRYLPSDRVQAMDTADDGLWVGTNAGLVKLAGQSLTLAQKADVMFETMQKWYWRMGGFASASAFFAGPWSDEGHFLGDDDNDGQWTQEAVGALCYAYAVTGDETYYQAARKAVTNMIMLIDVPAVSFLEKGMKAGFVSRSLVRDDEGAIFDNKATQANWHLVHYTDGHDYYWKDDTSSDETTGHFFGLPLYYDLCAKDDVEREWVGQHIGLMAGYILDNGLLLVDLDGEPTEHGYWNPERLAIALDGLPACLKEHDLEACVDAWGGSAFLNSVEILGAMLAAWHTTGEQRFLDKYNELIDVHRYDELATFSENVVTWSQRGTANYCDHELADLAFLTLLRYDPNPERRALWLQSMLSAYKFEVGERNPLKSLAMAAFTAEVPGLSQGVETLREYPLDLRQFRVDNSTRMDLENDVKDRQGNPQFKSVPSYAEIQTMRWDANPYAQAAGGDGSARMNPAFWLLPYWGLRYHGAIGE